MTLTPVVRLRIDLGPGISIGPGKIALLEQIERSGSLSQAARVLKMSYRRAWLLLDDLNHGLAAPVTTASVGGSGGGGAQLTEFGRRVVAAYREVEQGSLALAAERLEWLTSGMVAAREDAGRRPINRPLARAAATPMEPAQPQAGPAAAPAVRGPKQP